MKLPQKLIITLKDSQTNLPVPNQVVFLLLRTPIKNDFDIGPQLTNNLGQVAFEEGEIIKDIESITQQSIMDYSATYADCSPEFAVVRPSTIHIRRALDFLNVYQEFDDRYARALILMQQATNSNLAEQKWDFNTAELSSVEGVAHIECKVD